MLLILFLLVLHLEYKKWWFEMYTWVFFLHCFVFKWTISMTSLNSLFLQYNRKQFLEPGESVLMISMVKKLQKLTNKKVQLILTNKPKLIYVDPAKLMVKGNIIWSDNPNDLSIQVMSPSNFKICTVSHASSHPSIYLLQSLLSLSMSFNTKMVVQSNDFDHKFSNWVKTLKPSLWLTAKWIKYFKTWTPYAIWFI